MNKSETIGNLAKALAAFQSDVENPKNTANNPFFKSKYAPLNDILTLVRPLLSKHGLSVLQSPSGDGKKIVITTILMHESGEWIESEPLILEAEKATAQGAGSAITYGRRYAISAMLGISSEDDDDGNHASGNKDKGKTQQQAQTKRLDTVTLKKFQDFAKDLSQGDIKSFINGLNIHFKNKGLPQITDLHGLANLDEVNMKALIVFLEGKVTAKQTGAGDGKDIEDALNSANKEENNE